MAIPSSSTDSSKKYSLFFVISIIVFTLCTEFFLRSVVVKLERSTPKLIDLVYTSKLKNVVVGDSQMYRAFIAGTNYVNLARRGNPLPAVEIVLKNYLHNKKPEKVIIQASPQLFATPQLKRNTQRYDMYFNINTLPIKPYMFERGITEFLSSIKSIKQILKVYNSKSDEDLKANSEKWLSLSLQEREERTLSRVIHHIPEMNSSESIRFQAVYLRIIEFLLSKGASVCMVTPPVTETYLKYSNRYEQFKTAMSFFDEVSQAYNIKLIKQQHIDIKFPDSVFINQDHLAPIVSKQFSSSVFKACFNE